MMLEGQQSDVLLFQLGERDDRMMLERQQSDVQCCCFSCGEGSNSVVSAVVKGRQYDVEFCCCSCVKGRQYDFQCCCFSCGERTTV